MIKVVLIGMLVIIVGHLVREYCPMFLVPVYISGSVIIGLVILDNLADIIKNISALTQEGGIDSEYILLLIKMVGISYLSEISKDICTDAGFTVIGNQVDTVGKLMIMALSLPVISNLIEIVLNVL